MSPPARHIFFFLEIFHFTYVRVLNLSLCNPCGATAISLVHVLESPGLREVLWDFFPLKGPQQGVPALLYLAFAGLLGAVFSHRPTDDACNTSGSGQCCDFLP